MAKINCSNIKNCVTNIDPNPWLEEYNKTIYIIGGGPSLQYFNWKVLDNDSRLILGINRAYEVLPNMQITYFTDEDWYDVHKKRGFLEHPSIKIKGSLSPAKMQNDTNIYQLYLIGERGLCDTPGHAFHGRNSPYAATNLLVQWGFKKIYLLGIDMKWGGKANHQNHQKQTHWHDGHRRIDSEGTYKGMSNNWKALAPLLKKKGVEIINVNTDSNLQGFVKKTYEEIFGPEWKTDTPVKLKPIERKQPKRPTPPRKPKVRKVKPVKKKPIQGNNLIIRTR